MSCGKETYQCGLDRWLGSGENTGTFRMRNSRDTPVSEDTSESTDTRDWNLGIPLTISCIELTMKHDKLGNVIDWIKGEPKGDYWDGSRDNREKTLEDHTSKHGWMF